MRIATSTWDLATGRLPIGFEAARADGDARIVLSNPAGYGFGEGLKARTAVFSAFFTTIGGTWARDAKKSTQTRHVYVRV